MSRSLARSLPRLAGALLAVVLSLSMVVTSTTRAEALDLPTPVKIGGALGAAPAGAVVVGGAGVATEGAAGGAAAGLCATGVGCLVVGAAAAGLMLYATKDSWMPVAKSIWNGLTGDDSIPYPVNGGCTLDASVTKLGIASAIVTGNVGQCGAGGQPVTILWDCFVPATGQVVTRNFKGEYTAYWNNPEHTGTAGWNQSVTCGAGDGSDGQQIVQLMVYRHVAGYQWVPTDPVIAAGAWGYPDSAYEQKAEVQCKNNSTGELRTLSVTYAGEPEKVQSPSCSNLGDAWTPVKATYSGGVKGHAVPMLTIDGSGAYDQYGDCFNELGLVCSVRVFVGGQACAIGVPGCSNWYGRVQQGAQDVTCRFGAHTVDLTNCDPLRYSYKPGYKDTTVTTPGQNTGTDPGDQPDPSPSPNPSTSPNPNPSTSPNPDPNPSTTPVPNPTPDPIPPDADPDSTGCLGEAVTLNPVDWVYVPVKCAMLWAFRPDPSSWGLDDLLAQVKARPPFSIVIGLGSAIGDLASSFASSGCGTLAHFGGDLDADITCSKIRSVPGYSGLYSLVQVGLFGLTGVGIFRLFASTFERG